MPRYDYTSMGFYTFDCLAWPFSAIPEGGGTTYVEDFALAVSGAGGTAAIAAAKMGLKTLAVTGLGQDLMGDWVMQRLVQFGVDTSLVQRKAGWNTSSSIVTTRLDGSRPALHRKGATADFFIADDEISKVVDAKVFHAGGVGFMKAMELHGQTAKVMAAAQAGGAITTVDVHAGTPDDLAAIAAVLPHTDYFMPSIDEARALCSLVDHEVVANYFLALGAKACVLTLGAEGVYYRDNKGRSFQQPAYEIDLKCSCGCGDAFDAGFAVGLVKGFDIETCVGLGQATSALNASGLGSQAGVTDFEQTYKFMQTHKRKTP